MLTVALLGGVLIGPARRDRSRTRVERVPAVVTAAWVWLFVVAVTIAFALRLPIANPWALFARHAAPSSAHLLGTDDLGHDVVSRLVWGMQGSVLYGLVAVAAGFALGLFFGALAAEAGRARGAIDGAGRIGIPAVGVAVGLATVLSRDPSEYWLLLVPLTVAPAIRWGAVAFDGRRRGPEVGSAAVAAALTALASSVAGEAVLGSLGLVPVGGLTLGTVLNDVRTSGHRPVGELVAVLTVLLVTVAAISAAARSLEARRASGSAPPSGHHGVMHRDSAFAYRPALDGLRAFAVLAVIAYHLGFPSRSYWAPGGYLGVDAFFVISGYLITSLLLGEHRRTGRVQLSAFWGRRARRLLPAVLLLVLVIAVYARAWADPAQLHTLRGDSVATLLYVANWHFIGTHQSYFDLFSTPSPLRHMWSLAIEEQFYILWPLVVFGALRATRGRRAALLGLTIAGIAASTVWMAVHFNPADPSRAYYGTDTRAHSLLVGCVLALFLEWRPSFSGRANTSVQIAGLAGAIGILWAVHNITDTSRNMYYGGFLIYAIRGRVRRDGRGADRLVAVAGVLLARAVALDRAGVVRAVPVALAGDRDPDGEPCARARQRARRPCSWRRSSGSRRCRTTCSSGRSGSARSPTGPCW